MDVKGAPHGVGRFTGNFGSELYEGEFNHGQKHGFGRLLYWSNMWYEGRFENNLRHGAGVCINQIGKERGNSTQ